MRPTAREAIRDSFSYSNLYLLSIGWVDHRCAQIGVLGMVFNLEPSEKAVKEDVQELMNDPDMKELFE